MHAVLMMGLRPTTEPHHIFSWDYNQLKASFLGGCMFWVEACCSDEQAAAHY